MTLIESGFFGFATCENAGRFRPAAPARPRAPPSTWRRDRSRGFLVMFPLQVKNLLGVSRLFFIVKLITPPPSAARRAVPAPSRQTRASNDPRHQGAAARGDAQARRQV